MVPAGGFGVLVFISGPLEENGSGCGVRAAGAGAAGGLAADGLLREASGDTAAAGSAAPACGAAGVAGSALWVFGAPTGGFFRPNSMNVDPQVSQVVGQVVEVG
ncbi:hypothetical protein [Azospirillum brasilense]|uniref:hypothetical protein n=1 Tax=Azospirillum brasilense TaxID=192 RepID=UPI00157B9C7A|nr:hypothetical protein [Azospirillum brasilense]